MTRLEQLMRDLLVRWRDEGSMEAPGLLSDAGPERSIEAGTYGDPHRQHELPDEWRQDTDGWQVIIRFRR